MAGIRANFTDRFPDCAGRLTDCSSRIAPYLHLLNVQATAVLSRVLFGILGIVTIWVVANEYDNRLFYLLCLPVFLLVVECIVTIKYTEDGEWKWFCPCVFLCVAGVVPGIWLLQIGLYVDRVDYRDSHDLDECGDIKYNETALEVNGKLIPENLLLSSDQYPVILEQILFFVLIMGRWLLPKGQLTRDQLSQLLLVYIGIAADSLEFSLETLKIKQVLCNLPLIIIVLAIWSWSLTQFMLVLTSVSAPKREAVVKTARGRSFFGGCCENEIWAIVITMLLQDAPYLIVRLYLIIAYKAVSPLIIFFTFKNSILVLLQVYRMVVVCGFKEEEEEDTARGNNQEERIALDQLPAKTHDEGVESIQAAVPLKSDDIESGSSAEAV